MKSDKVLLKTIVIAWAAGCVAIAIGFVAKAEVPLLRPWALVHPGKVNEPVLDPILTPDGRLRQRGGIRRRGHFSDYSDWEKAHSQWQAQLTPAFRTTGYLGGLALLAVALGLWSVVISQLHRLMCRLIDSDSSSPFTPVVLLATVGVVIGLGDLPYGYFRLLRLVLWGVSILFLVEPRVSLRDWQLWSLIGFVGLYNPLFPVYLGDKSLWVALNIATAVIFWMVNAGQRRVK